MGWDVEEEEGEEEEEDEVDEEEGVRLCFGLVVELGEEEVGKFRGKGLISRCLWLWD